MSIHRRGAAATLALALGAGSFGVATLANASSSPAWAATLTKAFPTKSLTTLGATAGSTPVHVALGLSPRNAAALSAAFKAENTPGTATYHQFLTPAQFAATYAPTAAQVQAVEAYLTKAGFTHVSSEGNHLLVTADGTAAVAERAFRTPLVNVRAGGRTFFVNTAAAQVPASLAGTVKTVLGLNTFPVATPHPLVHKASTAAAGSPNPFEEIPPADFQNTYHAQGSATGSHTAIAIMSEGATTQVIKDLRTAEAKNHLPVVPVSVVPVGPQSADTSGADEFSMDTQASTAIATTVKHLYMYNIGQLLDTDIVAAINKWTAQDVAQGLSASLGGCDYTSYLDGSMFTADTILQEAGLQGQSFFASSGDNGDACMEVAAIGAPAGAPGTNWPASGTFTTAVGGTSLLADAKGNRVQELGWLGSGGGVSTVENPGFWTQDSDPAYNADFVTGGRAVPDVALDADPNTFTAAEIYVDGQPTGVGGTSLSSPLMLGIWARLESAHANKLGFAPADLYRLYDKVNPGVSETAPLEPITVVVPTPDPKAVPGFTDITVGSNGTYPCLPGYDLVTGLGAPDIAALSKAL